jgi:hypothetical protein
MPTATFRDYSISAEYLGNKGAPFNDAKYENYNNHRVVVRNSKTRTRVQFEFWASLAEPELRKPSDLRNAFECFLTDAIAGEQDFAEFCSDFGYDEDSRKAERIYKACKRAAAQAHRLLGSDDLYDLANQLREAE